MTRARMIMGCATLIAFSVLCHSCSSRNVLAGDQCDGDGDCVEGACESVDGLLPAPRRLCALGCSPSKKDSCSNGPSEVAVRGRVVCVPVGARFHRPGEEDAQSLDTPNLDGLADKGLCVPERLVPDSVRTALRDGARRN